MLGFAFGVRIEHQQSAIGQNEYRLVDQLRPNSHKVLFPELQLNAFGDLEHLLSVFQSLLQGRLDLFNQFGLLFYLPFVAHPFDLGKNRRQIPVDVLYPETIPVRRVSIGRWVRWGRLGCWP